MDNTKLLSPPPDDLLLARYLAGESTPSEDLQIAQWGAQHIAHSTWLAEAAASWQLLSVTQQQPQQHIEAMRARMLTAISALDTTSVDRPDTKADLAVERENNRVERRFEGRRWSLPKWNVASYLAVAGLVVVVGLWSTLKPEIQQNTYSGTSVYTTPKGQRASVTLPDGSEVILNAGSRLEVPGDFAMGNRVVDLSGEGLFTVAHNSGRPFTVTAGPSTTRVLGTRFSVRHYEEDSVATIAVHDGKVAVDTVVLTAQRQVRMSAQGFSPVMPISPEQFSFVEGRLVLNNVMFREAIPDLNRWYDIEIRLGDAALEALPLTLETTGGSVMDLQRILEVAFSLRVERTANILTIFSK